jgi:hypothetical protein
MTPLIIGTAIALLALESAPATAPPTEVKPAVVTGKVDDNADADRIVCKNQPLTGSRFTKRVCMTKAQWGEQQRQVEVLERRLNQTATPTGGGGYGGG